MDEKMHKDGFEKELKREADDLLLQPSDQVWKDITGELHPRRRMYRRLWAACILALLSLGIFIYTRRPAAPGSRPAGRTVSTLHPADRHPANPVHPAERHKNNQSATAENTPPAGTGHGTAGRSQTAARNAAAVQHHVATVRSADKAGPEKAFVLQQAPDQHAPLPVLPALALQPVDIPAPRREIPDAPASFSSLPTLAEAIPFNDMMPELRKRPKKAGRKPVFELSFTPAVGYRVLKTTRPRPAAPSDPVMSGGNAGGRNPAFNSMGLSRLPVTHTDQKPGQQPAWGWAAGARVLFPFGKHWQLQTGASLAKTGYQITAYSAYTGRIQANGAASPASSRRINSYYTTDAAQASAPALSSIQNSYLHIAIPLLIGRDFGNPRRVHLSAVAGPALTYLLKADEAIYSPETKRYFSGQQYLHPLNADLHLGVNIDIPAAERLMISIGPSLQYQLFSTYKNHPRVKEHPYLIGIKTGMQWR